jgi:hypothetical protein
VRYEGNEGEESGGEMTQPIFGQHSFAESPTPNAVDAFDLITGEQLQNARAQFPERSFLVDENVQAVADRIHSSAGTQAQKEAAVAAYVGKWIIVAFNLGDHRSRFGMEIVTAQQPWEKEVQLAGRVATPTRYGLTAIFDTEPWNAKIASMPIGTRVTCMGQLDQINAAEIRLRNCELVNAAS